MNRYLKLVHYEVTRFRFIYLSLLVVTLLSQFGGVYLFVQSTMNDINERMEQQSLSAEEYVIQAGTINFSNYTTQSMWFMAPIALCVAALLLYVFMIWYRDWLGKNMFIYRLMMLPISRMNMYLAKVSVILLTVLGLIAFQLLVMPLQIKWFDVLLPEVFRNSVGTNEVIINHPLLNILIPQSFIEFVLNYGAGAIGVIIIFTAILMERSYRWKGIAAGIIYSAAAVFLFFLPILISELTRVYLYPIELFFILVGVGILIACGSVWLSFYLLKNKVSV